MVTPDAPCRNISNDIPRLRLIVVCQFDTPGATVPMRRAWSERTTCA